MSEKRRLWSYHGWGDMWFPESQLHLGVRKDDEPMIRVGGESGRCHSVAYPIHARAIAFHLLACADRMDAKHGYGPDKSVWAFLHGITRAPEASNALAAFERDYCLPPSPDPTVEAERRGRIRDPGRLETLRVIAEQTTEIGDANLMVGPEVTCPGCKRKDHAIRFFKCFFCWAFFCPACSREHFDSQAGDAKQEDGG